MEWRCRLCPARSGSAWSRSDRCLTKFAEPPDWSHAERARDTSWCRPAPRQLRERSQVDWLDADRFQVIPEESCVADLIIGVVMNVLRHIAIEQLQGLHIRHVAPVHTADFVVLSSTELRVLLP